MTSLCFGCDVGCWGWFLALVLRVSCLLVCTFSLGDVWRGFSLVSAVGLWLIAIVVVLVDACVVGCFAVGSTGCAVGWVGGDVDCGLVGLRLVCFGVVLWFGEFCCRLSVGLGLLVFVFVVVYD